MGHSDFEHNPGRVPIVKVADTVGWNLQVTGSGKEECNMIGARRLGQQGLDVSEIGLGCMGMTYAYGTPDDQESVATLHRAIDLGCTLFDTAEIYGPFANEELLGRALQGRRDQVVIATKFGYKFRNGERVGMDSRPEHIKEVADASLRRLRTDRIDLLYQHRVDPSVPVEDVAGAVKDLIGAGKVRCFGLSEASASTVRRAHAVQPVTAVQSEYSLFERGVEESVLPTLRELGIGFIAYSPLGRGFLTGMARRAEELPSGDYRASRDPRLQGTNFDENMKLAEFVQQVAQEKRATPSQVALAWLLHQGDDIVPIPGTKRRRYLEENLGAAALDLSREDLSVIGDFIKSHRVAGERYPSADLARVNA